MLLIKQRFYQFGWLRCHKTKVPSVWALQLSGKERHNEFRIMYCFKQRMI